MQFTSLIGESSSFFRQLFPFLSELELVVLVGGGEYDLCTQIRKGQVEFESVDGVWKILIDLMAEINLVDKLRPHYQGKEIVAR